MCREGEIIGMLEIVFRNLYGGVKQTDTHCSSTDLRFNTVAPELGGAFPRGAQWNYRGVRNVITSTQTHTHTQNNIK